MEGLGWAGQRGPEIAPASPDRGVNMLDPWIIEEIRRREEKREQPEERLELPLESPYQRDGEKPVPPEPEEERERGVVIIDL